MEYPITTFTGINNVTAPYKLPDGVGTEFLNIDIEAGTLKSAKDYISTGESMGTDKYWNVSSKYNFKSADNLSVVYFNGYVYTTKKGVDPTSKLQRHTIDTNTITDVGLEAPTGAITLSDKGVNYYDDTFVYAYYYYAVTYYDPITGDESAPLLSPVIGAIKTTRQIDITGIDTSQSRIRIYRVGNYITKFSLVVELPITGNSMSYDDIKGDTSVTTLMNTSNSMPLEDGATNLTFHQGTFYASIDNRLRFSVQGKPGVWKPLDYIDLEDDIVGLASVGSALIIFLRHKVYILAGSDINTYVLMALINDSGCVSTNSISVFRSFVIFMSDEGLCVTDGNSIQYITRFTYNFDKDLEYLSSVASSDRYFLLTKNKFLYCVDMRHQSPMLLLYDNVIGINSLATLNGELYGCGASIVKYFASNIPLKLTYNSKDIVGQNYNKSLEIEKISCTFTGSFLFYININNDIIEKKIETLEDIKIEDNFVQAGDNETIRVSTKLVGTGEVYAINFSVTNMEG